MAGDVPVREAVVDAPHRVLRGILLEVRPLPMAAALLIGLLGLEWAGARLWPVPMGRPFLLLSIFFGLLAAHLMDSKVDVVDRGDRTSTDMPWLFRDSTGLMHGEEYRRTIAAAAVLSLSAAVPVGLEAGAAAFLLLACALLLALLYSPLLDKTFLGVTFGYPAGAIAVLAAGFLLGGGVADPRFAWLALALFAALVGIKVRSDVIDIEGDRAIGKRTVASAAGKRAAEAGGYALAAGGLVSLAALALAYPLPALFPLPPLGAAAAILATVRLDPVKASLWMSHAMLAALALSVVALAL